MPAPALILAAALSLLAGCTGTVQTLEIAPSLQNTANICSCNAPPAASIEAIVRIATGEGADGSGIVVGQDRVITAAHVVDNGDETLVWVGSGYRPAQVLATDVEYDLALLSVSTGPLRPLHLATSGPRQQEPVWAVGYPLALDLTTTHGEFRQWSNGTLFTSAPIRPGNSGGGLLRCEHGQFELAGMVRAYGAVYRDGELVSLQDSLSISVPASAIQAFMDRQPRHFF